jgi:transposase
LLYHGFKVRGYQHVSTEYIDDAVIFHLQFDARRLQCSACGGRDVVRRGTVPRLLRTVPIGSKSVWLQVEIPRLQCRACGLVRQARQTLADSHCSHTHAFAQHALELSRRMTIKDVARQLHVGWDRIKEIQKEHLRRYARPRLRHLRRLAIDELSIGGGHRYVTLVINWDDGVVVFVGDGKGADALKPFWPRLWGSGANIQAVAIDMSPAYISAVERHLSRADLVFDHFHIVKLLNEKLSELRRLLYRQLSDGPARQVLKGSRWLLLKRPENLDERRNERERLEEALRLNQPLAAAYYLKEDLRQLWEQPHRTAARNFLTSWVMQAMASDIKTMQTFARTLLAHSWGILNWYKHPISTGPLEGLNNKIQTMKRQAYGFRDPEFFKLKIYALHETRYALVG